MNGEQPDSSRTVLVVDDDPQMVECIEAHLKRKLQSATVVTTTSPSRALEIPDDTPVDCVVSDYEMPGMNGVELCLALRNRAPAVPLLIFTSATRDYLDDVATIAGATDVLRKDGSGQMEELVERVERAITGGGERVPGEVGEKREERAAVAAKDAAGDGDDRHGNTAGDGDDRHGNTAGKTVVFSECVSRKRFDVATTLRTVADALEAEQGLTVRANDRSVRLDSLQSPTFTVTVAEDESSSAALRTEFSLTLRWTGDGNVSEYIPLDLGE